VLGLIIGLLIGTRMRIKAAIAAAFEKMAAAKPPAGDDGGDDGEDDKDQEEDDSLQSEVDEILQQYMSNEFIGGLDDHPETEFNPILLYQVKKAKDELRAKKQLEAQLAARDLPPNHLETLSPEERAAFLLELKADPGPKIGANVGSVAGKVRKYGATVNSTRILVDFGAKMTRTAQASSSEDDSSKAEKAAQEVRDRLKVIDGHLSTVTGVDVTRDEHKASKYKRLAGKGNLVQNALDAAKETKYKHVGEPLQLELIHKYAARGRSRVGPPLDHAIAVSNERQRRGSVGGDGAPRRASLCGAGRATRGPKPGQGAAGDEGSKATSGAMNKLRRASALSTDPVDA